MLNVKIESQELLDAMDDLAKFPDHAKTAFHSSGLLVSGTAAKYAPKSPTKAEMKSDAGVRRKKARRRLSKKKGYTTISSSRRIRSSKHYTPGTLQASIKFKATNSYLDVFVPVNSPAGSYAYKMHEERYKSWRYRGVGTKKKGQQAREKFISRAYETHLNNGDILNKFERELERAMR